MWTGLANHCSCRNPVGNGRKYQSNRSRVHGAFRKHESLHFIVFSFLQPTSSTSSRLMGPDTVDTKSKVTKERRNVSLKLGLHFFLFRLTSLPIISPIPKSNRIFQHGVSKNYSSKNMWSSRLRSRMYWSNGVLVRIYFSVQELSIRWSTFSGKEHSEIHFKTVPERAKNIKCGLRCV